MFQEENENVLEVDIVEPQEAVNITEEVKPEGFKNIFTEDKYNTEREARDSYDALNEGFILIDDIRGDFSRMANASQVQIMQEELRKLMPELALIVNGIFDSATEKALRIYDIKKQMI